MWKAYLLIENATVDGLGAQSETLLLGSCCSLVGGGRLSGTLSSGSTCTTGGGGTLQGVDDRLNTVFACSSFESYSTITDHQGGGVSAEIDVKRERDGVDDGAEGDQPEEVRLGDHVDGLFLLMCIRILGGPRFGLVSITRDAVSTVGAQLGRRVIEAEDRTDIRAAPPGSRDFFFGLMDVRKQKRGERAGEEKER